MEIQLRKKKKKGTIDAMQSSTVRFSTIKFRTSECVIIKLQSYDMIRDKPKEIKNLRDDIIAECDVSFAVTTTVGLAFQFHQEQSPHLSFFFFRNRSH